MKQLTPFFLTIVCMSNVLVGAPDITGLLAQAKNAIEQTKADEAIAHLLKAEALKSDSDDVQMQLAMLYYYTRQPDKSRPYYEQHVQKNPDDLVTQFNLATIHSMLGMFEKSGPVFENLYRISLDERLKSHLFKHYLRMQQFDKASALRPVTHWWYSENIAGKTIILDCDLPGNGFGDTIQFVRYAGHLKKAGARVIVIAQEALIPLLKLCPSIDRVITKKDPVPPSDTTYSICIASLMILLKDYVPTKQDIPYLFADPDLIKLWKKNLEKNRSYKIGICWECSVSRNAFTKQIVPNQRSISLDLLTSLKTIPNVTFYSLQRSTDFPKEFSLIAFNDDFDTSHGRFMDSAALMKNLDLVITVDTSLAHLAGALGVPVWLLLTCESDYRWFTKSTHTPYYPTMRLFRQTTYGDWNPVVEQLKKNITRLALAEQ